MDPVHVPHFDAYHEIGTHDNWERHKGIEIKMNFVPERVEFIVVGFVAFKVSHFNFGCDIQIVGNVSLGICGRTIENENVTVDKEKCAD